MILKLASFFQYSAPLSVYEADVNSQYGEDGVIAHIVGVIQPAEKYCVEFGAWDGKHLSNCNALLTGAGWGGLMIEANAEKYEQLAATYASHSTVRTMNRLVDFEGPNRLDRLLEEAGAPKSFGLLSIDIDGNDYYIWESLVDYTPEVVVIEFNPTVPNDVVFVQDKSFEVNQGCSLMALVLLAKRKGYELVAATKINAFFVRADKFAVLGISDNFISVIYRPMQDGRIFQGCDGSIHVVGMNSLIWRGGEPVSSEDFQIVPKDQRVWGDAQRK